MVGIVPERQHNYDAVASRSNVIHIPYSIGLSISQHHANDQETCSRSRDSSYLTEYYASKTLSQAF